ncbi:MAG: phosphonate ABC transporter substrate-binding protein [Pseudomonadota bacterium]
MSPGALAALAGLAALLSGVAPPAATPDTPPPITEFRIGILSIENAAERLRNNECLRERVEALLGVPTTLFTPADYEGVVQGLLGGNLDLAWLGASSYAKIHLQDPDAVEPVLARVNLDGGAGYYSIAFARIDSGVTSLDDLRGEVFAFGDPNSTSGFLVPSTEMSQAGYSLTPGEFFGDVVFTGGHEQTIVAVYNDTGPAAGVTWTDGLGEWEDGYTSGALRKAVDAGLVDPTEMREIWRSKLIPEGPIVLRKALPERVKLKLVAMLAALPSLDPDCAYGVVGGEVKAIAPVDHEDYATIVEARRRIAQ